MAMTTQRSQGQFKVTKGQMKAEKDNAHTK